MAKRLANDGGTSGNPANIRLDAVRALWLDAPGGDGSTTNPDRFLLLQDEDTGDVLMPLIYMKPVLEANYSRKLASLKNRLVSVPSEGPLAQQDGLLYWQWAFESPHNVKVLVRKELGDDKTPQGHLRLVLLPIVYNAMAQRADLRAMPLFKALHRALKESNYYPLLRLPAPDVIAQVEASMEGLPAPAVPLFGGPRVIEATAIKYMFMFKDQGEMEASKRMRTTATPAQDNGVLTATIVGHTGVQALFEQHIREVGGEEGEEGEGGDLLGMDGMPGGLAATAAVAGATAAAATAAAATGADMCPALMEAVLKQRAPSAVHRASSAPGPSHIPGLQSAIDPVTADAVRQLVELKYTEVVGELQRLKHSVVQLYGVVTHLAQQPHGHDTGAVPGWMTGLPPLVGPSLADFLPPRGPPGMARAPHPSSLPPSARLNAMAVDIPPHVGELPAAPEGLGSMSQLLRHPFPAPYQTALFNSSQVSDLLLTHQLAEKNSLLLTSGAGQAEARGRGGEGEGDGSQPEQVSAPTPPPAASQQPAVPDDATNASGQGTAVEGGGDGEPPAANQTGTQASEDAGAGAGERHLIWLQGVGPGLALPGTS